MSDRCPDCKCELCEPHEHGCDIEECPFCHGQALTCGCQDDYSSLYAYLVAKAEKPIPYGNEQRFKNLYPNCHATYRRNGPMERTMCECGNNKVVCTNCVHWIWTKEGIEGKCKGIKEYTADGKFNDDGGCCYYGKIELTKQPEPKASFKQTDNIWLFTKPGFNIIKEADIWFALIHLICDRIVDKSLRSKYPLKELVINEFTMMHLIDYIDVDEVVKYIKETFV